MNPLSVGVQSLNADDFGVMLHSPQLSRLMDICSQPQQLAETSTANAREALTPASDYMIAIPLPEH